jgi:hypothetical protein
MKMIGFRMEYDKALMNSRYIFETSDKDASFITKAEKDMLVEYLEKSDIVFSKTLALFDGENYIAPYMIFSDGEWIWPSYFSYNVARQDYINSSFLFHVQIRNYKPLALTEEQRREAIFFLEKEMLKV